MHERASVLALKRITALTCHLQCRQSRCDLPHQLAVPVQPQSSWAACLAHRSPPSPPPLPCPATHGSHQIVNNTYPPGLGEPLNVILSAESDPAVLVDSLYDGGFQNYML